MELCLSIFQISRHNLFDGFDLTKNLEKPRIDLKNKLKPNPVLNISQSGIFFVQFFTPQYVFKCSTRVSGTSRVSGPSRVSAEFDFNAFTDVNSKNIIQIRIVNSLIFK